MALPLVRSWAANASRCSRRTHMHRSVTAQVRHNSFAKVEEKPFETPEDWTDFQLKRAEYQTLSA